MPLHHSPQAFENGVPVPTAMLNGEFAKQDKDHNGSVDFDEFKSFHVAMMAASFGQMDRNKDGGIDAAEFAAITAMLPPDSPQTGFSDLDVNHDGKLDQSEFFGHEE
jgi:Ca2+-binding EF-hand superfamily protein